MNVTAFFPLVVYALLDINFGGESAPARFRLTLWAWHSPRPQLTSCSYCRLVSLFRTLSFIRRKSRTTGSLPTAAQGLEEKHQHVRDKLSIEWLGVGPIFLPPRFVHAAVSFGHLA